MRIKANPNLLRQKLTQLWQQNIYNQKPYKIETVFIKTFKLFFLIKIFLTTFRNSKLFLKNRIIQKKLKKLNHKIINISNFKLLNINYLKKQNNLFIFCNVISRTNLFLRFLKTYNFKTKHFNLVKKLKKNKYILKLKKNQIKAYKKIKFKKLNFFKLKIVYILKKKPYVFSKQKNKFKKLKLFNKIILKAIKKKIKLKWKKKIKYKMKKQKKIYKMKKQKIFFKLIFFKNKKTKKIYWNKLKKIIIIKNKIVIKNKKLKNFKNKKVKNFQNKLIFIYTQFFTQILENNLFYFLLKIIPNLKNIKIKIQQTQNFPKLKKILNNIFKIMLKKNYKIKKNLKTFNHLLNLLPSFNLIYNSTLLNQQFAIELAKTKKHWRIIKTLELFLIKYLNTTANYLKKNSQITGMQIIIIGRPNKIERTKKIKLKYGFNKQTNFQTNNLIKTFTSANAQIGSFGTTFLISL